MVVTHDVLVPLRFVALLGHFFAGLLAIYAAVREEHTHDPILSRMRLRQPILLADGSHLNLRTCMRAEGQRHCRTTVQLWSG